MRHGLLLRVLLVSKRLLERVGIAAEGRHPSGNVVVEKDSDPDRRKAEQHFGVDDTMQPPNPMHREHRHTQPAERWAQQGLDDNLVCPPFDEEDLLDVRQQFAAVEPDLTCKQI